MHFSAPLIARTLIAPDTYELQFDTTGTGFSFLAGQYVTVTAPLPGESEREQWREFSLASSSLHPEHIAIAFRASHSPFKQFLLHTPLGTRVDMDGPKGMFLPPSSTQKPVVFVAGGIGVTPFLSMMGEMKGKKSEQRATLMTINHDAASSPYRKEIDALIRDHSFFGLVERYGRPDNAWVQDHVHRHPDAIWYIAGPPAMVQSMQMMLEQEGIDARSIRTESFTGYDHPLPP